MIRAGFLIFALFVVTSALDEEWNKDVDWSKETGSGSGKLNALDVICGKDHMTVRAEFSGPFQGLIFSKGTYGQDSCVYVKPYSAVTHATFKVYYDKCGTKPDLKGKYYENTIIIQYGSDVINAWDEAKRLRCEWFEAYEKPATFRPAIPVADLDVVEMNFQGDDIDCWMEIQDGKGPWGREINRIVPVGQLMTIVVSINDFNGQFDMRVKSCFAHDGVKAPIQLTDDIGCVLRPKMLTKFMKVRDPNGRATVISYSHFYAFKFPDTMNVQIQCTVEVCRHGCPDACTKGKYPSVVRETKLSIGQTATDHRMVAKDGSDVTGHNGPENLHRDPPPIPGIPDVNIAKHAAFLLRNQGVNDDQLKKAVYRQNGTANMEYIPDAAASESKPIVKVLDIDVPMNDKQKLTITEQNPANLLPEDIRHASKFLSDLGLSVDLGSLATDFMDNLGSNQEVTQLLKNDKLREFALASGINLRQQQHPQHQQQQQQQHHHQQQHRHHEQVPSAEALIGGGGGEGMPEPGTPVNPDLLDEESGGGGGGGGGGDSSSSPNADLPKGDLPKASNSINRTGQQVPSKAEPGSGEAGRAPHSGGKQEFHKNPGHPNGGSNRYLGRPGSPPGPGQHHHHHHRQQQQQQLHHQMNYHQQQQQQQQQAQQPVVQVFEIPLRPGLMPQGALTNQLGQGPPPLPQPHSAPHPGGLFPGVLKRPAHHHFGLPFLKGLEALRRRVRLPGSSGRPSVVRGQPPPVMGFPHGPRSMRFRRSAGPEVRVHKQFQVVTSIDLNFAPNATDVEAILEGRRAVGEEGVCMARTPFIVGLSTLFSVIVTICAFSASVLYRIVRVKSCDA